MGTSSNLRHICSGQQQWHFAPRKLRSCVAPSRRVLCSSSGGSSPLGGDTSSSRDEPDTPKLAAGSLVYRAKAGGQRQPSFPLTVPLLPFPSEDVLTPGGTKVLHLYEARYLALLERALKSDDKIFAHVAAEQPVDPGSSSAARLPGALVGSNYVLALGTLVQIVEVKAQGVGALVRVQGEARVAIESLKQAQPYIIGEVTPLMDDPVPKTSEDQLLSSAESLAGVLRECSDLCAKFGGVEAASLQQAVLWSERQPVVPGLAQGVVGSRAAELEKAHRLAWAALCALPQASETELRQLLRFRLAAMACTSSLDRLQLASTYLEASKAMLAARVAIKSLNIGAS